MQLIIREGTDKATTVASIRVMLAAVVAHFEHAITLRSTDDLTVTPDMGAGAEPVEMALAEVTKAMAGVRAALQHPEAAGLELSSDMIPVGTLVADPGCEDSGIVVGAFRGTSGTLYVYVNARGQANSQYEAGLEWPGKPAEVRPSAEEDFKFRMVQALGGPHELGWSDDRIIAEVSDLWSKRKKQQARLKAHTKRKCVVSA